MADMLPRMRFGTLSLVATMLLVVSGAGWWTFHRDLYVEETKALEALQRGGLSVTAERGDGWINPPEDEAAIPWYAPLVAPLAKFHVEGDPSCELRDVALRLPRLKTYGEQPSLEPRAALPWNSSIGSADWESYLGRPLPAFEERRLDLRRLEAPLPSGTPVDDAEAARIAAAIYAAWTNSGATPVRILQRHEDSLHVAKLWDEERGILLQGFGYGGRIECVADGTLSSYERFGNRWKRVLRMRDENASCFRDSTRNAHNDQFPFHGLSFNFSPIVVRTFEAQSRYELDRVEKLDDTRCRVDFAPFEAARTSEERESGHLRADPRVESWRCVLRSDLDWAPEETSLVQALDYSDDGLDNPVRHERRVVQRFRREGPYVLLVERIVKKGVVGGPVQGREWTRFAADIDPDFAESAFDPLTLDEEVWAEPRPLPFWRWYRVTFAVSLAIFALLIGRSASGYFRRPRGSNVERRRRPRTVVDQTSDDSNTNASSSPRNLLISDSSD